jgi:hypothetical protein
MKIHIVKDTAKFFVTVALLALSACRSEMTVQLLEKTCSGIANGNDITGADEENELCLIIETERPFLTWRWSDDGSTLAFALHDPTITRPAGMGKFPSQPLTTDWYVMERNNRNATEFTTAHNKGLSLSPDGEYGVVSYLCSADTTGCHDVYTTRTQKYICSYKTYTVWFSGSDCPELILKNGEVWDLKYERNKSGCEYFHRNGWDTPSCDGSEPVTLTPMPTTMAIPYDEQPYPTSTPIIVQSGVLPKKSCLTLAKLESRLPGICKASISSQTLTRW